MEETIHIQSEKSREKITDIFCKLIACSAILSSLFYVYLKLYDLASATGFIALLFLFFVYLNKRQYHNLSRTAIIVTTNLGVLAFSIYLGYASGIYLYLFVAPFLIYLLFDFNDKKKIFSFLLMYVVTFIVISLNKDVVFPFSKTLSPEAIQLIYTFNFCSTFILCFGLVLYFANNNNNYIVNLKEHKDLLTQEVALRTKSEDLLKKSLKEREVLLSEIHHRVKNNLSIISALLNMQIGSVQDETSKQVFEETRNRIYAMALIHNLLYQNHSFVKIEFIKYVEKFCENIFETYKHQPNIKIEQRIEDVEIDLKTAIPLALIMNELVTNAFKHAFNGKNDGRIEIGIKSIENNQLLFWVKDNGVGMNRALINTENSMGFTIINSLVEQLDATLSYENKDGSSFMILLPLA